MGHGRIRSALQGIVPAVIDQAIVSGTNFVTVILLARVVEKSTLGFYALILAVGLLLSNAMAALITQPLSVMIADKDENVSQYIAAVARMQVVAVLFAQCIVAIIWTVMDASHLGYVLAFFAFWQLQEFTRRVMFALERPRSVLINDIVAYGGQAVTIALLLATGRLTLDSALATASITSGLGVVIALVQIPELHSRSAKVITVLRSHWRFGHWILLSEALNAVSARLYIYLSAAVISTSATGVLQAIGQITNALNVFMFALMSTLLPRFARILKTQGAVAVHLAVRGWLLTTTGFAAIVLLLPLLAPEFTLHLLYGAKYDSYTGLLRLQSVVALLWIPTFLLALGIRVHRDNRIFPVIPAVNIVLALTIGLYLLQEHGLEGALIGYGIAAVTTNVLYMSAYMRARRKAESA